MQHSAIMISNVSNNEKLNKESIFHLDTAPYNSMHHNAMQIGTMQYKIMQRNAKQSI